MIDSQQKYYRKLARFIQVNRELSRSILKEIGDGLTTPIAREKMRVSSSEEESLKPFDEKRIPTKEEYDNIPIVFGTKDKVRAGERIHLEKERDELLKELVEYTNFEPNEILNMNYSSIPKKHFRFINGFKHFLWNGIEFTLNEKQSKTLELIYHHFLNNNTKIFLGYNFIKSHTDSKGNKNINRIFRGTQVMGTIILDENKNQGEYRLDIDF